jgi:isoquinoline 1-oxidoreductase beta subunit
MTMAKITFVRRSFLQALGLGAAGLSLGIAHAQVPNLPKAGPKEAPGLQPNVFVHIRIDGTVTIVCHRSEMGQGVRSTLPVLIADEIGADPKTIVIVQADGDKAYGDQNTDGSGSIRKIYDDLRRVGATARVMLIAAAAKKWGVKEDTCTTRDGMIVHLPSKKTKPFSEVVGDAAKLKLPDPKKVTFRPDAEMTHVFRDLPLLDGPDIVTGKAQFGADVKIPQMLIAVIARPPVVGGKVKSFDPAPALAIAGVKKVVELPQPKAPFAFQALGGVAVIADDTWSALRGRAALSIAWDDGPNAALDSTAYREELLASVRAPGDVVRKTGDVDAALAAAAKKVEAEYFIPHLAHAPMEPPACLAAFTGDGCEVWTATQNPQAARTEVARALGVDESKVTVHVTLLGGGFGRKSKADFASEAALLSKAAGAPVRVQWTREDDIQHDYYHSTCAVRLAAGLDKSNKITAWLHRSAFPSISSTFKAGVEHGGEGELQQGTLDFPFAIPNVRAENGKAIASVRIGWLRSVHNINFAFATGSFIDEIAQARGDDPRDVLLEVVGPPRTVSIAELGVPKLSNYGAPLDVHPIDTARLRRVIERVTELSSWKAARKAGRFLGLAAHRSFLTYTAAVVSVVKLPSGKIHVDEAWLVADAGKVINRERARSQMEGAVIFGMSIALYGAITLKKGAVEQTNFRDYRLVRIGESPRRIHVEIAESDARPGGIGEPGVPPVAPAIANAVFAATGKRVRDLPLSRAGLA